MKKKNTFEKHPYAGDYEVINAAFNALKREQEKCGLTLRDYRGVSSDAYEQFEFENNRIKEVKAKVLGWYLDELRKQGIEITHGVKNKKGL